VIVDYHVHTQYCGHARGKTVEYVEAALKRGLAEIGFADHLGRYYLSRSQRRRYWDWGMNERALSRYYSELIELREAYADRITIRIGLEVDFIEGAEDLLGPVLRSYPFDFLLGSIHCLPRFGWRHLAKNTTTPPEILFAEYFTYARAAIDSGVFQSLAHLDFVWRYIPWPGNRTREILNEIAQTVQRAAVRGMCVEVNANAYNWDLISDMTNAAPFATMVKSIAEHKAPITLGTDAHTPAFVGNSLGEICAYLGKCGISHVTTFQQRRPKVVPLG
jgi:histidinol-phosphatase (PHP family)